MPRSSALRAALRHPFAALLCGVLALVALAGVADRELDTERAAVPVPLPVYEIESVSNGHRGTLLGVLPPFGVAAIPMPIDVDGDLAPDVTVAVNLINVAGLFDNPPGEPLLAPTLEINRLLPGLPLTPVNPPLRINVKLTILDVGGSEPTMLRLGYDTGEGGSIPAKFKVVADGVSGFFDPVTAMVATPGYEGPLTLVAGLEQVTERTDADLRFDPLPGDLRFSYGSSDAGQRVTASHGGAVAATGLDREVDLTADVHATDAGDETTIRAHVDRLPRSVAVDILPGGDGAGGFTYAASSDGRLPDVRVDALSEPAGAAPMVARLDLESLPPELHADWSLPEDGPAHIEIDAPVRPIGAVEARVANFLGEPSLLSPYVPTAQQFVDLRQSPEGDERIVAGRVEGISHVSMTETGRGLDASFESAGGGRPLELHASLGAVGESRRRLDATSTVSPLPGSIDVSIEDAGEDESVDPLTITYVSSDSVDVEGRLEARAADIDPAAPCGDAGTICADLTVRDLPAEIVTRIGRFDGESRIAVDADPRLGASRPSVRAGLAAGLDDGQVLEADVAAVGIPEHLRLRLAEDASGSLSRAEFHACDRDYEARTCAEGSEGDIRGFEFAVRNFLEAERPDAMAPLVLDRPQAIAVSADGSGDPDEPLFEAAGRFTAIKEVQYLAEGTTGLRVRAGSGDAFQGQVRVRDLDTDTDDPDNAIVDLDADLGVPGLPGRLDICFHPQGEAAASGDDEITRPCDAAEPFGTGVDTLESPLAVGYSADSEFDIDGHVLFREEAVAPDEDDVTVVGDLVVDDLPRDLVTHLLLPIDGEDADEDGEIDEGTASEAVRAHFFASESPFSIAFGGRRTTADFVCEDARPGADAVCISGTLLDFPETVDLFIDPSLRPTGPAVIDGDGNNLVLATDGGSTTRLEGFDLSAVTPVDVEEGEPPRSDVLLVDGSLTGIPADVAGTLRLPDEDIPGDEPQIDVVAEPALGRIDVHVANFLPPDTFDPVPPPHAMAGTTFDQQVILQSLGDLTKAHLTVSDLERVAFRPVRDADGAPLDTKVVTIEFGDVARTARAYVDVNDTGERLLADVVLDNLPSGADICVRGERTAGAAAPAPDAGTWCDGVDDEQGAFRIDAAGTAGIGFDAFVRQTKPATGELLAARLTVDGLPPTVQAALPVGDDAGLDIQGLAPDPAQPDDPEALIPEGIDFIEVELAEGADLEDDGWANDADRPFDDRRPLPTGGVFPAPETPNQHLSMAEAGEIRHVRAEIGPDSQLQRLSALSSACAAPPNNPTDYPHFPDPDPDGDGPLPPDTTYQCVAGTFAPSAPDDRLDLSMVTETGANETRRLRSAGLTDLPPWFQMTLTDTPTSRGEDEVLRPRCGPEALPSLREPDCMAPLLRFDQPLPDAQLFGVLEDGHDEVLADLDELVPTDAAPNFIDIPPTGDPGVRARVLEPGSGEESATTVAFRLPLPQSLTVEQPQTWSETIVAPPPAFCEQIPFLTCESSPSEQAKDIRFAYAVRDASGAPVDHLGDLAVFALDGEEELLVTDVAPNLTQGVPLPGEFGLDIYLRDSAAQGRKFVQIDGRTSMPLQAGLRMFDGGVRPDNIDDDPFIDATGLDRMSFGLVDAPEAAADAGFDDPSFRIRFEMLKPPAAPSAPPSDSAAVVHQQMVGSLDAVLDFDPSDGSPARRIEGVALLDAPNIGFELAAFADLDNHPSARVPAEFSASGTLDFDKMNYRLDDDTDDAETEIRVVSHLTAQLNVDRGTNFILRNNVAKIDTRFIGPGSVTIGPINWEVERFRYETDVGTADIQAELTYLGCISQAGHDTGFFPGVPICGVDTPPFAPVSARFHRCSGPDLPSPVPNILDGLTLEGPDVSFNGTVSLFDDGRFDLNVIGVPDGLADLAVDGEIEDEAMRILCNLSAGDYELIHHEDGSVPVVHPGDPLASPGHDVPPAAPDVPPTDSARAFGSVIAGSLPDFDVHSTVALCGLHRFRNLVVHGGVTLDVAHQADTSDAPYAPIPRCRPGGEGRLVIIADSVIIHGTIDATGVISEVPTGINGPTFNGGGGHGGDGGNGSLEADSGANAFGELTTHRPQTEPGMPGAPVGGGGGLGGGMVVIASDLIDVFGAIHADGTQGAFGSCDGMGGGTPGTGGGSGGGVSLVGESIGINGVVTARGGHGTAGFGGGGGGGGGVVKVQAPEVFRPDDPNPAIEMYEGDPGGSCDAAAGPGEAGTALDPDDYVRITVASAIEGVAADGVVAPSGWVTTGDDLRFAYATRVPWDPTDPPNGALTTAYLCIVPRDEIDGTMRMPVDSNTSGEEPCGTDAPYGAIVIGESPQNRDAVDGIGLGESFHDFLGVNSGPLVDGVYGAWMQVCQSTFNSHPQVLRWFHTCGFRDPIPDRPDYVFGVDTTNPTVIVTIPDLPEARVSPNLGAFATASNDVVTSFNVVRTQPEGAPITQTSCRIGPVGEDVTTAQFFACSEGTARVMEFPDGLWQFTVRVDDAAGRTVFKSERVLVDHTIPETTLTVEANPPPGNEGWHRSPPTVTVTMRDLESGWSDEPVRYSLDGGTELGIAIGDCTRVGPEVTCEVPLGTLAPGEHRIRATGVDLVGNRLQARFKFVILPWLRMRSATFLFDPQHPDSALATVPAEADGGDGWFVTQPLAVATARDQLGASGLDAALLVVDGGTPVEGPVAIAEGPSTEVCSTSIDVAGNPEPIEPAACLDLKVDLTDPTVAIHLPAAPASGWHLGPVTATVSGADALSGIAPDFGSVLDPCVQRTREPQPSGVCVSIDGGPFLPSTGSYTLDEGVHSVRAFAVDRAGRRSTLARAVVRVDMSAPVASARLVPPAPARGAWWRRVPTLVLRAEDGRDNAGVERIEYSLDGAPFVAYEGPVDLTAGRHTVVYRAIDRAGLVGADQTFEVPVDDGAPTARALAPNPLVWAKLLGPSTARLNWVVGDDRSSSVRVTVLVVDAAGNTIRRIDGGTVPVTPGGTVSGFTSWDGRTDAGANALGVFHYRVLVIDEAGNRAQSGESRPIQVKLL